MKKKIIYSLLFSFVATHSKAVDQTFNITQKASKGDITYGIFDDKATGLEYDTATINFTTPVDFDQIVGIYGAEVKNLVLNFENANAKELVAIERNDLTSITESLTINISSGTIGINSGSGNLISTRERGLLSYTGIDGMHDTNNINISGTANIMGDVVGGAGAQTNNIKITGGQVGGDIYSGNHYFLLFATKNPSVNSNVIIENSADIGGFFDSFDGDIVNQSISGKGNLFFNDITDDFNGEIYNFNTTNINNGELTLQGTQYYSEVWNIDGKLNTNSKDIKGLSGTSSVNFNILSNGVVNDLLNTSYNITLSNKGVLNGVNSGSKNITLNNYSTLAGNYTGGNIAINNYSTTSGVFTNPTFISSNVVNLNNFNIFSGAEISSGSNSQIVINNKDSAAISGDNTFNAINGGSIKIINEQNGVLSGTLNSNGNFQDISNNGLMQDFTLNNDDKITLINGGTGFISGALNLTKEINSIENTGAILNTTINTTENLILNNNSGGTIYDSFEIIGNTTLNNKGRITLAGFQPADYIAIKGLNTDVNNLAGGIIEGGIEAKSYNQAANSTWVSYLNKDTEKMSIIDVTGDITIEQGAKLYINSKNDAQLFSENQVFKFAESSTMTQAEVDAQIQNFTLVSDTPFANYTAYSSGGDGYLRFNRVSPELFSLDTQVAASTHSVSVLGSHRTYEMFLNRDMLANMDVINMPDYLTGKNRQRKSTFNDKLSFIAIGGRSTQDGYENYSGYNANYLGGVFYFEHNLSNNIKSGLAFSYLYTDNNFKDAFKSNSDIKTIRPFAYINYENNNWHADLAFGFADHKTINKRYYQYNDIKYLAKSDYTSREYSGHLNLGYEFISKYDISIEPQIGIFAARIDTDSYSENGDGLMNLHIDSEDYNSLKTMVGLKLTRTILRTSMNLKPELHLRWYRELGDTKGIVSAYFLENGQTFQEEGIESPKDIGDIAIRLTSHTKNGFDIFAETYYQMARNFRNIGLGLGLQYNF